jgi:hypothetical protein
MAWRMKAKYYESCNCELGCPCNMSGFPSHGFCEGAIAFEVTEGERDGVDLTGAKVAAGAKWPGAIHEGNGTMVAFVDCTDEQLAALGPILMAEDPGLPWEVISATFTDVHGPFRETITIEGEGNESRISVGGGKYEVQMQSFTDPVSGAKHQPRMVLEDGFIFQDGVIGTTSTMKIDHDGVTLEHPGKNAYYAEVEWSSENRMAPATTAGRF